MEEKPGSLLVVSWVGHLTRYLHRGRPVVGPSSLPVVGPSSLPVVRPSSLPVVVAQLDKKLPSKALAHSNE